MTTRSWQRSWLLEIWHNASVWQGWTARLLAVTRIPDRELWQTQGSAQRPDSPPPPAQRNSEMENTGFIWQLHMHFSVWTDLSVPPDWCCEEAVTDEGKVCLCPPGNTGGCICFPPPDMYVRGNPMWLTNCDQVLHFLTVTRFRRQGGCSYLSQEVLLRILVKRRYCACRSKPCIDCNVIFVSFTETAIIWDADIFL